VQLGVPAPRPGYAKDMNTIETSHDPTEQVTIAREQAATATEPTLPDEGTNEHLGHRRWLMGTNLAVGVAVGVLATLALRVLRRHR
jgi:hypothetical protein